jgi:ankyrin repeat protein
VNAVDANGETAMHGAALKNLPKVVQFLANNGAKVEVWNKKNKFGSTPLMFAQGYRPWKLQAVRLKRSMRSSA